jgi:hypothetical protein
MQVLLRDRLDHRVLAGEVSIYRTRRHPGFGHEILHRGLMEPVADEAAPGRGQYVRPPFVAVFL